MQTLVDKKTTQENQKRSAETVINPDCVHLFEYNNDKMIFDLASGMVLELTDFAYEFLNLCRKKDWPEVTCAIQKKCPGVSVGELEVTLDQLKANGLFKAPPQFREKAQEERVETLWQHHPCRLQLVLSQSCNLSCIYCYMEKNQSNARRVLMSKEQAFQAVDHLVNRSGRRRNLQVTFFGGEPLLNFSVIKDVVQYCRECEKRYNKSYKGCI